MLNALLAQIIKPGVSDVHLKANEPPLVRHLGQLLAVDIPPMTAESIESLIQSLLNEPQKTKLKEKFGVDFSMPLEGIGRLRVNVYRQQGSLALAIRLIPSEAKNFDQLFLPKSTLEKLCRSKRGLFLISGVTGAGKTTTLNAIINYMNDNFSYNIITLEDPIEYVHSRKNSSISQREVGRDVLNFPDGLEHVLRQDPDVIVIGELMSGNTFRAAIEAAGSGHLVIGTIHSNDCYDTVERIVNAFDFQEQPYVRLQLTNVLTAIIGQRLVPEKNGRMVLPATEILLGSSQMKKLILSNSPNEVRFLIEKSGAYGMHTFDQDLLRMFDSGLISPGDALNYATNPNDLRLKMQGSAGGPGLEMVK
ncbi:MAG: Twitching mobility protein [Elusimicrobia bacterium]|nr:Twitching mobility protein [Elusimicrobiota bacterium]